MKKRLVFVLGLFVVGLSSAHALTWSSIRTQIRYNVRDTDATRRRYSDAVLLDLANEVQKDVNNWTWAVESSTGYVLTARTTYYSAPTDFLAVQRAVFRNSSNITIQLKEVSLKSLIDYNANYEQSSGPPTQYMVRDSTSGAAAYEIAYLPVPTTASTGTVRVDYVAQPTDMSSDSDVPFGGLRPLYPYHYVIALGTTARIKGIEGKVDEMQVYQALYEKGIALMKSSIGRAPNYTPSIVGGQR